jgi:hypothetical protein
LNSSESFLSIVGVPKVKLMRLVGWIGGDCFLS